MAGKNMQDSKMDLRVPHSRTMVLLVDDQAMVAEAVRRLLAGLPDIDLHYCADGNEAIKQANRIKPNVILQDLVMPSIDGLDLVQLYRANPGTAETPIVVLSSEEDPRVKKNAFALGADDYLVRHNSAVGGFDVVPPAEVVADLNSRFQTGDDQYFTIRLRLARQSHRRADVYSGGSSGSRTDSELP